MFKLVLVVLLLSDDTSLSEHSSRISYTVFRILQGGYLKTALLLQAMLGRMPAKLFYLKLDADAVLSPPGLAHFVDAGRRH
jgi:hypothetical protein